MEVHDPANYRAESHDKYPPFWNVPMLPSAQLMGSVGATTIENFYVVGEAWAHVVGSLLPGGGTVLDIGCGCATSAASSSSTSSTCSARTTATPCCCLLYTSDAADE